MISFSSDIKQLFRERDREEMLFALDLWSHESVKEHAYDILDRVESGVMPCDGAWPDERIDLFRSWILDEMPP